MCPGSCFGSEAGGSSDALGHSEGLGRHKWGDNWQSRWGCLYPSLFQLKKLQKQMEAWLDRVRSLKQKLPAHPVTRDAAAVQADAQREALPLLGQAHCPAKQDLSGAWRTLPGWRPRPGSGGTQALVTRQIRDRMGGAAWGAGDLAGPLGATHYAAGAPAFPSAVGTGKWLAPGKPGDARCLSRRGNGQGGLGLGLQQRMRAPSLLPRRQQSDSPIPPDTC